MRKSVLVLFVTACCLVLVAGNALALDLGANITIWDGMGSDAEDNEVEPGCVQAQKWDLEAFFLNDSTLTMVGGYNFRAGEGGYASGDIFIDVNGDAKYGPANTGSGGGNSITTNTFGYDYVLDLDFSDLTYTVYGLTDASTLSVWFDQNEESKSTCLKNQKSISREYRGSSWHNRNIVPPPNTRGRRMPFALSH